MTNITEFPESIEHTERRTARQLLNELMADSRALSADWAAADHAGMPDAERLAFIHRMGDLQLACSWLDENEAVATLRNELAMLITYASGAPEWRSARPVPTCPELVADNEED